MSAELPHRTSADEGDPLADVLASGDDTPAWRPTPQQRTAAIAVAAAVLVAGAVLAQHQSDGPEPAPPPVLVLAEGAVVLPRVGAGAPPGQRHVGLQIDVVNRSSREVRLSSAELVPGPWRVEVMDDTDVPLRSEQGRLLRPGWTATLVAHRLVDCTAVTCPGLGPRALVVDLALDGRHERQSIDVGLDQPAYGGKLHETLGRPESACEGVDDATPWDPPFLQLRTAAVG